MNTLPFETLRAVMERDGNQRGGAFTVRSRRSGKDYTYKLRRRIYNGITYTHCYIEREYLRFTYIGTFNGNFIKKSGENITTEAGKGLEWVLRRVVRGEKEILERNAEMMHLGKCVKCGKKLTDAKSIETGMGKWCREH